MSASTMKFVVSMEDTRYFTWQLAVFLESFRGKLPEGWEPWVVVCNDHEELSPELTRVLETYGTRVFTAEDYSKRVDFDFIDGRTPYPVANKITAFEAVAPHLAPDDMMCLLDTDMFLYGALNQEIFPTGNALVEHYLIREPLFFSDRETKEGVDLQKLREAIGATGEYHAGGVVIFLTGKTVQNRAVVKDCFRFSQVLYLLGKVKQVKNQWISEMPAYALSLTANGIPYDLLDRPEFSMEIVKDKVVPEGTLYHYYAPGAFFGSPWGKPDFRDREFLRTDLERFLARAQTDHEREFFEYAIQARDRLGSKKGPLTGSGSPPGMNRGKKEWIQERVRSSLRFGYYYYRAAKDCLGYLRFHTRAAMDPEAPARGDLDLPGLVSLLYRVLEPARSRKG